MDQNDRYAPASAARLDGALEAGLAPPLGAPGYMPQLDALRALAIGGVLVSHWWPGSALARVLPVGMIGVTAFFVLSGYLITRLLLEERRDAGFEPWRALGRFYLRRTLRIFPAYYLTIALLFATQPQFRDDVGWYLLYASNFLFHDAQAWVGPAPHTWTLAVEEQFYLGWPLLLLFAPRRMLPALVLAAVAAGPLSRALLFHFSDGTPDAADFAHVLMPSCLDCFALGALLALRRDQGGATTGFGSTAWLLFLIANAASLLYFRESHSMASVLLFRFNVAVLALALIARASTRIGGPVGSVLESRLLVYLGRVSYGMYLFHVSTPAIYAWLGLPLPATPALAFLAWLLLLVALASASWFAFERPINRLGKRFGHRALPHRAPAP